MHIALHDSSNPTSISTSMSSFIQDYSPCVLFFPQHVESRFRKESTWNLERKITAQIDGFRLWCTSCVNNLDCFRKSAPSRKTTTTPFSDMQSFLINWLRGLPMKTQDRMTDYITLDILALFTFNHVYFHFGVGCLYGNQFNNMTDIQTCFAHHVTDLHIDYSESKTWNKLNVKIICCEHVNTHSTSLILKGSKSCTQHKWALLFTFLIKLLVMTCVTRDCFEIIDHL